MVEHLSLAVEPMFDLDCALWSQADAVALCRDVEAICPEFGCHVALTGGTLYKNGHRKDVDLLFYRIRQVGEIDRIGLMNALFDRLGIQMSARHGWVTKATLNGKVVDLFFPDHVDQPGDGSGTYS